MARSFDEIYASLGSAYDPSAKLVQDQIAAIPGSVDADIAEAEGAKNKAFGDITNSARRRGMGFSGVPLGEQAQYASDVFSPAVLKARSNGKQLLATLTEQSNALNRDRTTQAQGLLDNELNRDFQERQFQEQVRQFNEQQAAAKAAQSAGAGAYLGGLGGAVSAGNPKSASMTQRQGGGFNFTDASGKAISAAAFAQLKGIPFRDLLNTMYKAGDNSARSALSFVGNDFGADQAKMTDPRLKNIYQSLVWGVR